MEGIGHKVGQGDDDDYLAEQGKEDCLLLLVQGFEDSLADILTIHENESRKILFQGRNGITDQCLTELKIRISAPGSRRMTLHMMAV